MSKTSMNTMYKEAKTDVSYNDWEMLILAHELSHCLDRATDVPGELGQPLKALNSIAPSDRKHPANTALPSDPISLNLVPT